MRRRPWAALALLAVAALVGSSLAQAGRVRNGGTFHATLQTDIENVDPARSYYVPEWQYEWMTGRMLLSYTQGAKGYRLFNDGITKYTVSKDGKTYTFFIRHGMRFSNGRPITAANFRYEYLRILNPNVQSPIASFFTDPAAVSIVGATGYNAGKSHKVAGLRTSGKYVFVISFPPVGATTYPAGPRTGRSC